MKNFKNVCRALPKDKITVKNINEHLDSLSLLNIPFAGLPIDDFFIKKANMNSLKIASELLLSLVENAVVKMNQKFVFHNDLKDSNILIDEPNGKSKYEMKIIDWGMACYYKPGVTKQLPLVWLNRPFQFNNPYSIILFSGEFVKSYNDFLYFVKYKPSYDDTFEFAKKYIHFWLNKRGNGHIKFISRIVDLIATIDVFDFIAHYLTKILVRFTDLKSSNKSKNFQMNEYLNQVFIHNIDLWGFVTSFYSLFNIFLLNVNELNSFQVEQLRLLGELLFYTYTTSDTKLDIQVIKNKIIKFNDLFSNYLNDSTAEGVNRFKIPKKERSNGITGKTMEISIKNIRTSKKKKNPEKLKNIKNLKKTKKNRNYK